MKHFTDVYAIVPVLSFGGATCSARRNARATENESD